MSAPVLTFFNNKGGVGATSLVYHLAWMFASLSKRTLAVDLDPQTNLTAALLPEDRIANLRESNAPTDRPPQTRPICYDRRQIAGIERGHTNASHL